MTEPLPPAHIPTEMQIALFRAMEDVHDLTLAIAVLLVDEEGRLVAVSGDENDMPKPIRNVLSGKQLARAGSVRELLSSVEMEPSTLNVSAFDVNGSHVLAILFDAEADIMTVQAVGREATDMVAQILASSLGVPSGN